MSIEEGKEGRGEQVGGCRARSQTEERERADEAEFSCTV